MEKLADKDRERLRSLAGEQAEIASGDRMRGIYKDWERSGRFEKGARPMITVELWTFADEVIPQLMQCEGKRAREIEWKLLSNIVPAKMFADDTPVRSYWPVALHQEFIPYGLPVRKNAADGSEWVGAGYKFDTYFHDLEKDMALAGKSKWSFDLEGTQAEIDELDGVFGDMLPVLRAGESVSTSIALSIMERMSMEDLYMALYDTPELVHELFSRLIDDYCDYLDDMEARGLLLPTVGDEPLLEGSYCFTDSLPKTGKGLKASGVWGYMDAEEFNDVSPEMFKEFITDHYKKLAARFGAVSYGCCEAVHGFWDGGLDTLPNLRKVSVSAWCDQRFMGERLRGKNIVFLRKPTANFLGVQGELEEDAVRAYFRETAQAASGCGLEIVQRDVYLLHGNTRKVSRYVELIRKEMDGFWRP